LLVDEREHDAAAAVMANETLPALLKYHAAWDEFVGFQENQLNIAAKQAEVDYAKARRLASLLIVLAVAVALAIALFTTRETSREIAGRIDAQKEVSKLNAQAPSLVEIRKAARRLLCKSLVNDFIGQGLERRDCQQDSLDFTNLLVTSKSNHSKRLRNCCMDTPRLAEVRVVIEGVGFRRWSMPIGACDTQRTAKDMAVRTLLQC